MTIKIWIYLITDGDASTFLSAINEHDCVTVTDLGENGQEVSTEMKHYALPAWCLENGCQCRVVVKEFEI